MEQEASRTDTDEAHRTACSKKLAVLLTQKADLSIAIEELLDDIESGRKYMKVYKQMKMYNDRRSTRFSTVKNSGRDTFRSMRNVITT